MSQQNTIQQTVQEAEYAATSATGNASICIYNYHYGNKVQVQPDKLAHTASENLPCPYRGLFHFGPKDAEFFYGRETFVDEIYGVTQRRNFIPVLGASGSGKSSVVLAGLVPKLQKEGLWQFTHFRPGSDPFYALAEALVPLYNAEIDSTDKINQAGKLADLLKNGMQLSRIFSSIQVNHPHQRILLIADQFEEIFTLCHDQIRSQFLDCLLASLETPNALSSLATVLVTTMRADFLGNALSYRPLADVLQNADLKLGPMNGEELAQVIERPAAKLGVAFETGLVERILKDVEDQPGNLPLLEFALTELWNKRIGQQLTHKIYEEIGHVEGALARHADEKYGNLDDGEKEEVRRIFVQLVRPGEGTEDTRRLATKAELGGTNWELVKKLADARLVVTSSNLEDKETVEVIHEALIRDWGELRQWMHLDRSFRVWQERLRSAIDQWEQTERDEGALLRGAALADAEEKLDQRYLDISSSGQEFIEASIELRDREQKQRQLRTKLTVSALTIFLVIVTGLSAITVFQWQLAKIELAKAQRSEYKAQQSAAAAQQAKAKELSWRANVCSAIARDRKNGKKVSAEWKKVSCNGTKVFRG